MSIAILSIPLGIISVILFVWSINKMGNKPAKGKKKDDDTALIEIIVSVILFFVALGIYDGSASTAGLFSSDNAAQEESAQHSSDKNSEKSEAQREVEEYNKAAVEKARSGESDEKSNHKDGEKNSNNADNAEKSDSVSNPKDEDKSDNNKNLEKQRQAYQNWYNQIEARIQSIDTTWSALWNDNSTDNTEKLIKALEHEKTQLETIKIPEELSAMHKKRLAEVENHYHQWIDAKLKACQMKSSGANQQDMISEIARGDGLKLRANVEVSSVGRELGISK